MEPISSSSRSEPLVQPLGDAELPDGVAAAIEVARHHGALSSTVLPRIWAHRPEIAQAQIALHTRFYDSAILSGRLLELVRLRVASINQCSVCETARKSDDVSEEDVSCLADDDRFSEPERAALRYATVFATDHLSVGSAEITDLRRYFSAAEVVELAMFTSLMVGSGRMAYALRAFESQ